MSDVFSRFGKFQCVQFSGYHSDYFVASVEERSAAIARLDGNADLEIASVV
jgi:hypothetical protein